MPARQRWYKALRALLLFLVFFDLAIAIPALAFPGWVIGLGALNADVPGALYRAGPVEPIFLRGVGLLWLMAAYVQYLAFRDPERRLVAVNIAIVFRFCGGTFELIEALVLLPAAGYEHQLTYWVLGSFVAGDYLLIAAMVYLLHKLDLPWWSLRRSAGPATG